jgi:hypothetical protein
MERIVKSERKADDQQRRADLDAFVATDKMFVRKHAKRGGSRQGSTFDLNRRDVDCAGAVDSLTPHGLAVAVERNREADRFR